MNSFFDTERLIADRITSDHTDSMVAFNRNEQTTIFTGGVVPEGVTEGLVKSCVTHWSDFGYGMWIISEKSSGNIVGRMGLHNLRVNMIDEIELAYGFFPGSGGQGYATEVGQKIIELIPDWELPIGELVGYTSIENDASIRVLEKIGFGYESDYDNQGIPSKLFRYSFA
jgi:RimJ/RimL family protein N-acetyltransferase